MDGVELPPGWMYTTVNDVLPCGGIFTDGDWVETKDQDPNGDVRLIQLADIGDGSFLDKSSRFLTKAKAYQLNCTFLMKDDILVARMPDPLGRCCIFPLDDVKTYITVVDICVIRLLGASQVDPKYMMYLINSPCTRAKIEALKTGSTRKRISRRNFASITMPFAPTSTQHRIVAKIDELFSELDKGVESLKKAREQLKIYRQAVLKHAFEGKLTAQWRKENKEKLETSEQLLARIKRERQARYEKLLEDWKIAVKEWEAKGKLDKKPPKPQKPKYSDFMKAHQARGLFWGCLSLGDLTAEAVLGKMLDKNKNTGTDRFYLANINIRWGKFDLKNLKTIKVEEDEIERYSLEKGDLVICEGGEPGRCAVWKETIPNMLIQKALHRVRFTASYNSHFAHFFMMYIASSGQLSAHFTGSTIKHLTGTGLKNVMFPICSLEEQNQIVRHLNRTITIHNELECQIEKVTQRTKSLRQSILKKAFTGQLVPQDSNDQPASVLLEKIKARRTAMAL